MRLGKLTIRVTPRPVQFAFADCLTIWSGKREARRSATTTASDWAGTWREEFNSRIIRLIGASYRYLSLLAAESKYSLTLTLSLTLALVRIISTLSFSLYLFCELLHLHITINVISFAEERVLEAAGVYKRKPWATRISWLCSSTLKTTQEYFKSLFSCHIFPEYNLKIFFLQARIVRDFIYETFHAIFF